MNYFLFNFSGVHRKERTPSCHHGRKTEKEHVNYSIKMKNNDSKITKLRLTFEKSSGTSYVTIVLLKIMRKNKNPSCSFCYLQRRQKLQRDSKILTKI